MMIDEEIKRARKMARAELEQFQSEAGQDEPPERAGDLSGQLRRKKRKKDSS